MLVAKTKTLVAGDPKDRDDFIGPMIDVKEAQRLDNWIEEAVGSRREAALRRQARRRDARGDPARGRRPATQAQSRGGVRAGRLPDPASPTSTRRSTSVNDSKFGLQAGIFTRDLFQMFDAWDRLEVGGVVINDVPSYRVDNMPYGGVKDSGLGREGIRFAMEDMTEIRNLVIRRRDEAPPKKHRQLNRALLRCSGGSRSPPSGRDIRSARAGSGPGYAVPVDVL